MIGRPRLLTWLIGVSLVLVTAALYWPATGHGFVNYDDDDYVLDNTHVTSGLSLENARWAFRSGYAANWHPLTWLSHMLDCQVFGMNPWGHHATNVLLHALNGALVFALLLLMTGARWQSLLVAALFAVHPLRVESVAWVSERKDVLSGFFGLLALIAYAGYAEKSVISNQRAVISSRAPGMPSTTSELLSTNYRSLNTDHRSFLYLLSLSFFALGLMSKPMLVTWPFVMLLLDYWPLGRLDLSTLHALRSTLRRLSLEKIPFFALAALASVVTFLVQQHGGAVMGAEGVPVSLRVGNALISYGRYLGNLVWPADLAVLYPYPGQWPLGKVMLAGGLLLGLSALVWGQRRRHPYLLMGWLWFLGMLVPVIGLVQVGDQAMADRYTYLPSLGVLVLAVWGAYELARGWRYHLMALSVAGGAAIVLCFALTRQQIGYWQDSEALFQHTLQVTENNDVAHYSLGVALGRKGQTDEAIRQFQEAIRLKPDRPSPHYNLGVAFSKVGQTDEAILQYQEAIRLKPDYANAHNSLGNALARKGQTDKAIREYQEAGRLKPDDAQIHKNLGNALATKGQTDEAILQYQEVIRLKPDDAQTHNNLGYALFTKGQTEEAIRQYQEALRLQSDFAAARDNLQHALAAKAHALPPQGAATNR